MVDAKENEETPDILEALEELVGDGRLLTAVHRRGEAEVRRSALAGLVDFDKRLATLEAAQPSADFSARSIKGQERAKLMQLIDGIAKIADALENAMKTDDGVATIKMTLLEGRADVEAAAALLAQGFESHRKNQFEPLRGLSQLLERIGEFAELGRMLRETAARAAALRYPLNSEGTNELASLIAARTSALAKLSTSSVDASSVATFLFAVVENKATLAELTPKIRDWIDAHEGVAKLLRVRL